MTEMTQQQADNLLNVATALKSAAVRKLPFGMGKYGTPLANCLSIVENLFTRKRVKNHCGTPACALGHYAARWDLQDDFSLSAEGKLKAWIGDSWQIISYDSPFIRSHFGVNYQDVAVLFDGSGCADANTPAQAAGFIEDFLEGKGWVSE